VRSKSRSNAGHIRVLSGRSRSDDLPRQHAEGLWVAIVRSSSTVDADFDDGANGDFRSRRMRSNVNVRTAMSRSKTRRAAAQFAD